MNKKIGERLKIVRERLECKTQDLFAAKLGIKQGTLSKYERGENGIPDDVKIKLGEFGISIHWLVTGEGEMLAANKSSQMIGQDVKATSEGFKVPLLRQKVSCGSGMDWESEQNIQGYIDLFALVPRLRIKKLIALCVSGTSMLGAGIKDGDYVFFDAGSEQPIDDDIYVFALDGEVFCKRLEFDGISKKLKVFSVRDVDLDKAELLTTLNLSDISDAERINIFGRVLYCVHPNGGDLLINLIKQKSIGD